MPGPVTVVTDSTAYLPAAQVADQGITVVPLQVVLDGKSRAEGIEVTSGEIAEALREWTLVTTSRPAPAVFAEAYRRLAREGARAVVSIHLSGEMSGTVAAARTAAGEVASTVRVHVVDSRSLGMGLGYPVLAAARAAAAGQPAEAVAELAARVALDSHAWLYVDTLEYLRRGGRIGAAQAFLGSALAVKPLLHLVDGRLEPLDRVRTTSRALARLEELVIEQLGEQQVDLAVHHLAAAGRAHELAGRLRERLPGLRELLVSEVGAVVGAHVGPGMLAVVSSPAV